MRNGLLRVALAVLSGLALMTTQAAAQNKTAVVKIGLNESLSGTYQPVGAPPAAAVRMAVKEINDAGGFTIGSTKYTIQLIEADNESKPATALAGITKLVEDDQVKFVFGPTQSALAVQTAAVTQPAGVIHLSAASLWQSKGMLSDPANSLLFGTQNPVSSIVKTDVQGMKELGAKNVVFMSQDDDTTRSIFPTFPDQVKAAGIKLTQVLFPVDASDFTSYISRAKTENPDMLFFFFPQSRVNEAIRLVLDLKAANTVGGHALNPNAAVNAAIGKPIPIPFFTSSGSPSFEYPPNDKVKAYRDRLLAFDPSVGGGLATYSFFAYDFVPMLVEAMKKAGTVDDTKAIGKALSEITYEGVIGKICFGKEMRTANSDGGIIIVKDGKIDSRTSPSPCS